MSLLTRLLGSTCPDLRTETQPVFHPITTGLWRWETDLKCVHDFDPSSFSIGWCPDRESFDPRDHPPLDETDIFICGDKPLSLQTPFFYLWYRLVSGEDCTNKMDREVHPHRYKVESVPVEPPLLILHHSWKTPRPLLVCSRGGSGQETSFTRPVGRGTGWHL